MSLLTEVVVRADTARVFVEETSTGRHLQVKAFDVDNDSIKTEVIDSEDESSSHPDAAPENTR